MTTRRGFLGAMLGAPIAVAARNADRDACVTSALKNFDNELRITAVSQDLAGFMRRGLTLDEINEIRREWKLPPLAQEDALQRFLGVSEPSAHDALRLSEWVEVGKDDGGFIVPKQLAPLMRSLLDGEIAFIDGRGAYKPGVGDHTPELLAPWELDAGASNNPEPISPRVALSIGASPDGGAAIPSRSPAGRSVRWVL